MYIHTHTYTLTHIYNIHTHIYIHTYIHMLMVAFDISFQRQVEFATEDPRHAQMRYLRRVHRHYDATNEEDESRYQEEQPAVAKKCLPNTRPENIITDINNTISLIPRFIKLKYLTNRQKSTALHSSNYSKSKTFTIPNNFSKYGFHNWSNLLRIQSMQDRQPRGSGFKSRSGRRLYSRFLLLLRPLANSATMNMLTEHCQLGDEMARERTGHPPSSAVAKKIKSLTLHTHGCSWASLKDCSSSFY